jgi:hypothetical protein
MIEKRAIGPNDGGHGPKNEAKRSEQQNVEQGMSNVEVTYAPARTLDILHC